MLNLLTAFLFVITGISRHQLKYNLFPYLKLIYVRRLKVELEKTNFANSKLIVVQGVYDYSNVFSGNYVKDNIWYFNNTAFEITDEFLYGQVDKWDYTPRVHFHHCEWTLEEENPVEAILFHIERYEKSKFFWHPSPATQRFFVILYLYLKYKDERLLAELNITINYIVDNVEIQLDGNHFLDNLIAILAYSILFDNEGLLFRVGNSIEKYFLNNHAYFPEKTPCYCSLLYSRLKLLESIPSNSKYFISITSKLESLLLNNPVVHLNDSYLEMKNWFPIYPKIDKVCSDYFVQKIHKNKIFTMIGNGFAKRGYQAHSHNNSAAIFVYTEDGKQIIGSFGTKSYAAGAERNSVRSSSSYFRPNRISKKINFKYFLGSFRNFGIDRNTYSLSLTQRGCELSVGDNGYKAKLIENKIQFINVKNSHMIFWSDYNQEELFSMLEFDSISLIDVDKIDRYDGIYNNITSYKYLIKIEKDLSSMIFY